MNPVSPLKHSGQIYSSFFYIDLFNRQPFFMCVILHNIYCKGVKTRQMLHYRLQEAGDHVPPLQTKQKAFLYTANNLVRTPPTPRTDGRNKQGLAISSAAAAAGVYVWSRYLSEQTLLLTFIFCPQKLRGLVLSPGYRLHGWPSKKPDAFSIAARWSGLKDKFCHLL